MVVRKGQKKQVLVQMWHDNKFLQIFPFVYCTEATYREAT
jgi:hypothetical protein